MEMTRRTFVKSVSITAGALLTPGLPSRAANQDSAQLPFEINFPRDAIEDLHRRIDQTRWLNVPYETGWSAGTNIEVLRNLVQYWRQEYDWFSVQRHLNQQDHFLQQLEGEDLHYIRYSAGGEKHEFPLLLLHGWPSSFMEFSESAPLLASGMEGHKGFDVIVPSLPGFVFSEAPKSPGMHCARMAERMHLLMTALGYERYGIQGGDWGSVIVRDLARQQPQSIVGVHSNSVTGPRPPAGVVPSQEEKQYRKWRETFDRSETAYSRLQGTRPQSLAVSLTDSPVGLLAWMLEKYWAWSDHGQDLWNTFDREWVLTNATLYWLTNSVLSASRIYYEHYNTYAKERPTGRVEVPVGYAHFPAEPWAAPRDVAERTNNIVHYTKMPRGGHFAATEQPELWAKDVSVFFAGL